MSWRQRLGNWIAGKKPVGASSNHAPAPTAENPNEIGPKTALETEPETPVTKPQWADFEDKSEYRRQYSRWSRAMKHEENSIARQLEAHRRAEELERQRLQAQQQPAPELSELQKRILEANPHLNQPLLHPLVGAINQHLTQQGVRNDSDDYAHGFAHYLDQHGVRFVRPGAAPAHEPEPHQQQQSEPEPLRHEPEPEPEPERPNMPSIPVSAPVSRSIAGSNGSRHDGGGKITLTPEQRHMARVTFTDPSMSTSEKERLYAQGLLRMQRDPNYARDGR